MKRNAEGKNAFTRVGTQNLFDYLCPLRTKQDPLSCHDSRGHLKLHARDRSNMELTACVHSIQQFFVYGIIGWDRCFSGTFECCGFVNFKREEARPAVFGSRHAAGQEFGKERVLCFFFFFCGRRVLIDERLVSTTSEKAQSTQDAEYTSQKTRPKFSLGRDGESSCCFFRPTWQTIPMSKQRRSADVVKQV